MVNKPLIRPYFLGVSFGRVARIPMKINMEFKNSGLEDAVPFQLSDF